LLKWFYGNNQILRVEFITMHTCQPLMATNSKTNINSLEN
jgi:hypothetical protein